MTGTTIVATIRTRILAIARTGAGQLVELKSSSVTTIGTIKYWTIFWFTYCISELGKALNLIESFSSNLVIKVG